MEKKLILDAFPLDIVIGRLCCQLIERHDDFRETALVGLQPRGVYFAQRLQTRLQALCGAKPPLGFLDATFHRDDFRRREQPVRPNATDMTFAIENLRVVLIDDVLFTGRSTRAALDAMIAFGRPKEVELLALVERKYTRELPIEATYVGVEVNSIQSQRVLVEWQAQGATQDGVWLTV